MIKYKVDKYMFQVFSSRPAQSLSPNQTVAAVYCYEQTTEGLKHRGTITFVSDDSPLLPAVHDETNGLLRLYFHRCQFDVTVNLLRTEEPLYLRFKNSTTAWLTSSLELTGEEETP